MADDVYSRVDPSNICTYHLPNGAYSGNKCISDIRSQLDLPPKERILSPSKQPCLCTLLFNFRVNRQETLAIILAGREGCDASTVTGLIGVLEQTVMTMATNCQLHLLTYDETYSSDDIILLTVCGISGIIAIITLVLAGFTFHRLWVTRKQQKSGRPIPVVR